MELRRGGFRGAILFPQVRLDDPIFVKRLPRNKPRRSGFLQKRNARQAASSQCAPLQAASLHKTRSRLPRNAPAGATEGSQGQAHSAPPLDHATNTTSAGRRDSLRAKARRPSGAYRLLLLRRALLRCVLLSRRALAGRRHDNSFPLRRADNLDPFRSDDAVKRKRDGVWRGHRKPDAGE